MTDTESTMTAHGVPGAIHVGDVITVAGVYRSRRWWQFWKPREKSRFVVTGVATSKVTP